MRIQVRVNRTRNGNNWHIVCPGCGHDDFHRPYDGLVSTGSMADVMWRAEAMWADHLYGFEPRSRDCPVERWRQVDGG